MPETNEIRDLKGDELDTVNGGLVVAESSQS